MRLLQLIVCSPIMDTVLRLPPYHPDLNPVEQIWGIVKTRIAAKNITFKLQDVQQLAEQNFAAVTMEEWAAVCRHAKAVEEYMSREHKMDSVMERITINADDDDDDDNNDDTSESTVSCEDNDDIQEVGPIVSDSE